MSLAADDAMGADRNELQLKKVGKLLRLLKFFPYDLDKKFA